MDYRQCKLEKIIGKSTFVETSWIPAKFVKLNAYLELKRNGKWDEGWKIVHIGDRQSDETRKKTQQDYKKQRPCSDV